MIDRIILWTNPGYLIIRIVSFIVSALIAFTQTIINHVHREN